MLSPDIFPTNQLLTSAFREIKQMDNYSYATDNLRIGVLDPDPAWLAQVRTDVKLLAEVGQSWITAKKAGIWSKVLAQFPGYTSNFSAVAKSQQNGSLKTADDWIEMLKSLLLPQLETAVKETEAATTEFKAEYDRFKDIQPLLDQSIQNGWDELADEEAIMVKIAGEIGSLQTQVSNLEDQIDSTVISDGKDVISSSVSIVYDLLTAAEASVPFLGAAAMAFTVGKMFYDVIEDTAEIQETLEKIGALQLEASHEAQAAAGTKAVIQIVYNLEKSFLSIQDVLPQISTLWSTEKQKVQSVIEALESGADPDDYLEILAIPTADANWKKIDEFVSAILAVQFTQGKAVVLDPSKAKQTENK